MEYLVLYKIPLHWFCSIRRVAHYQCKAAANPYEASPCQVVAVVNRETFAVRFVAFAEKEIELVLPVCAALRS